MSALSTFFSGLFAPKPMEPSYPALPEVDDLGQTNVPGIYAAGELAGTPLVKLGLNAGHDLVGRLHRELGGGSESSGENGDLLDLVIVGSGSSGYGAALHARKLGMKFVLLEAAAFANTFVTMTKGKLLLAEPEDVENRSLAWFEECTKEELLEKWRDDVRRRNLPIHEQEKVLDVTGAIDRFTVKTDVGEYRARRVLLCLGKAGNPRKLGVPGEKEHAGRIHHRLLDPDDFQGEDILIVGAGDVACEAAAALASGGGNRVVLSAIDREFTFPKKRNIDAVRKLESEGKLEILLGSSGTGGGGGRGAGEDRRRRRPPDPEHGPVRDDRRRTAGPVPEKNRTSAWPEAGTRRNGCTWPRSSCSCTRSTPSRATAGGSPAGRSKT